MAGTHKGFPGLLAKLFIDLNNSYKGVCLGRSLSYSFVSGGFFYFCTKSLKNKMMRDTFQRVNWLSRRDGYYIGKSSCCIEPSTVCTEPDNGRKDQTRWGRGVFCLIQAAQRARAEGAGCTAQWTTSLLTCLFKSCNLYEINKHVTNNTHDPRSSWPEGPRS